MEGLNNIREAYQKIYSQVDEALSADEKALRRELSADKKASKMPAKVASTYADSESRSSSREDKRSKGKHIHGYAMEETEVEEHPKRTRKPSQLKKMAQLKQLLDKKKETAKEEVELVERELDPTEQGEKERLVHGLKKSAAGFKKRYGKRWKNVLYATATARAKENMDTSRSDRRYSVER